MVVKDLKDKLGGGAARDGDDREGSGTKRGENMIRLLKPSGLIK
jgi:hypothetical protein